MKRVPALKVAAADPEEDRAAAGAEEDRMAGAAEDGVPTKHDV